MYSYVCDYCGKHDYYYSSFNTKEFKAILCTDCVVHIPKNWIGEKRERDISKVSPEWLLIMMKLSGGKYVE
jgi:hypothetical protein